MIKFGLIHETYPEQFIVGTIEARSPASALSIAESEGLTQEFEPGTFWVSPTEDRDWRQDR